jgi:hypothetical protein
MVAINQMLHHGNNAHHPLVHLHHGNNKRRVQHRLGRLLLHSPIITVTIIMHPVLPAPRKVLLAWADLLLGSQMAITRLLLQQVVIMMHTDQVKAMVLMVVTMTNLKLLLHLLPATVVG